MKINRHRSRDAPSHPSFASRFKKALPVSSPTKKGGGAPTGAPLGSAPPQQRKPASVCGEHHRFLPRTVRDQSGGALAFRRPTAVMRRGPYPRLGSGPRFLESPDPNGRTLSGTSAASTWQSGHAPDGRCPEPPGSRLQAPSGNRARPIDRLSPVDVPSMDELGGYVTVLGTTVKTCPQSRDSVVLERRGAIHRSALVVSSG